MRTPSPFFALPLLLSACTVSTGGNSYNRPPPYLGPSQPAHPAYAMPWMVGVPQAPPPQFTAATPAIVATPAAAQAQQARDKCLADAGTAADCEAALKAIVAAPGSAPLYDVYKKACERKAKLLGCSVFKSTAVTDADRPQVELLMRCESGQWEACEDVSTKVAPLQAWLGTLKSDGCKKGHSALCKTYKQCPNKSEWGCKTAGATQTTSGAPPAEVCGCIPRSCSGPLTVTPSPTARKWPDGTPRGTFTCAP